VIKIEIIFSYKWRVGVGWSGEGSLQWESGGPGRVASSGSRGEETGQNIIGR
jgi:hypothetical protein